MRTWVLLLLLALCLLVSASVVSEPNQNDNSAENDDENAEEDADDSAPTAAAKAKMADAKAEILEQIDPKVVAKHEQLLIAHRKAEIAAKKQLAEMQVRAKEAAEEKAAAAAAKAAGIKAAARAEQAHEASVKRESDKRLRAAMAKAKHEMAKVRAAAQLPGNGPATLPPPSEEEIKAAQRKAAAARIKTFPVGKIPVCLFLHGAGVDGPWPPKLVNHYGDVRGSLRTYWGPFNDWFADLCDAFEYSWANTDERGFQNGELSDFYARAAKSAVDRGGVIFAHSMANALLAWACHRGSPDGCVPWYNLGGGFSGQEIGDLISPSLRKTLAGIGIHLSDQILDNFSVKNGPNRLSHSGQANAMAKTVQDKRLLKGSMCGITPAGNALNAATYDVGSPKGLFELGVRTRDTLDGTMLAAGLGVVGGLISNLMKENEPWETDRRTDGLVEVAACAFWRESRAPNAVKHWYNAEEPKGYQTHDYPVHGPMDNPTDRYVLGAISHIEECGVFSKAPLAQNWMRNMMCLELNAKGKQCAPKTIPFSWPMHAPARRGEPCDGITRHCSDGRHCCMVSNLHGICQHRIPDHMGIQTCPADCVGRPFGKKGTCENADRVHFPRRKGEACLTSLECDNGRGCCNGKCEDKIADHMGIGWCKHECKGRPNWPAGSCERPGRLHFPRREHEDCAWSICADGRHCCDGKCTNPKKDWAGFDQCPRKCRGRVPRSWRNWAGIGAEGSC